MNRKDPRSWAETTDRAARSMVYVLSNRILFYQAVRGRNRLSRLDLPSSAKTAAKALDHLRKRFDEAVFATGDYEPVFFPDGHEEWAARTALSGANAIDSWGKVIRAVEKFSFNQIPSDVLGGIFQKLISPEERHKFGQHYTDENIVDVINAFCVRDGDASVLDPACGSGGFLVRAYYRKSQLDSQLSHHELLEGLYGCDINPFPAHLATLNLAARNITNQENYPRIVRKNFFKVSTQAPFCELPKAVPHNGEREREAIYVPELDAIVGNPPYVRQELIPKAAQKGLVRDQAKESLLEVVEHAWPGIDLSRQSDLHVYFWPAAATFLKEGGWFGFLTSSSWLDVRYGFPLQRWVLLNFQLVAVIESVQEPWFEDARVKTAVTILRRCSDEKRRDNNLARFVRIKCPLAEILGERADEAQKQVAAEEFRDLVLKTKSALSNDQLRIMVKKQADLWKEGLSVAEMFARQRAHAAAILETHSDGENDGDENDAPEQEEIESAVPLDYGGGKWGRYLRAPDFYFEIMREFGSRFVRLGDIATIKFGIKSGCDAFFMPRDVGKRLLEEYGSELEWRSLPLIPACKRSEVSSGKVAIIESGDKTLHPIEREFIRPEVHSLMQVDRPLVSADQLDRVVLWVGEPLSTIKGTYAWHYINWGAKQTFPSKKSKSVPVPERETCKGRNPWYGLTGLEPGIGFWPMAQKYRHIVPWNPHSLPGNHNLFDIHAPELTASEQNTLMAVLNSTVVGFFKHFYGRYAGSEGTLKTEVVDVLMLDIPDPTGVDEELAQQLMNALRELTQREVTHLVEQPFLECHTVSKMDELQKTEIELPVELRHDDRRRLDLLVFELLGVLDRKRRETLVDRLYFETASYHRQQRIQDIQSTINRARSNREEAASHLDLALDAWNELEPEWQRPLRDWLAEQSSHGKNVVLPEGPVRLPEAAHFFEATTLYFGRNPAVSHVCASREEAELLYAIADTGLRGSLTIPQKEKDSARLAALLQSRLVNARAKFEDVAAQRAGTDRLREEVSSLLYNWFILGRESAPN